ncbi:CsbD family protein [Mycobacterium sp. 1274761.0]|uniref:CsbD family protein n=1 Tax=Mycobacterium sp. 1274761.0 TaxID=1834077 RepID=UPI0007FF79F4|nr:CsbD family protein [Mycobacterium sp. 1274761.0]OBK74916.1 hypothetical protein A5651_08475 [Mycobacterium sp. 1274761.0]
MGATRKARIEFDRIAGRAKQRLGQATGDARMQDDGIVDELRARVRKTGERVKDALRGRRY